MVLGREGERIAAEELDKLRATGAEGVHDVHLRRTASDDSQPLRGRAQGRCAIGTTFVVVQGALDH